MKEVLRNRDFRLMFTGQAVSAVGDQIFPVAVTVQVLDHGGSVGDLGLVLAARSASLVLFALLGGVWADRLPRVRVLIGADLTRLVAVLGLALVMTGSTGIGVLAPLVFVVGAGEAFFRPAYGALIPSVLPAEQLSAGNALSGSTFHFASIIGPGLAGILVASIGTRGAMLVDAGTFGWSLAMLLRIREPSRVLRPRQRIAQEMAEGIAAVRHRRWIAVVLLLAMVQLMLVIPPTTVLLPKAIRDSGEPTASYGYILAISAAGGLLGSIVAGHYNPRRRGLIAMLALLPWTGEPLALYFHAPAYVLTLCWFAGSLGLGPFLVYWETALQQDVPAELLARVISLDWMCSFAMMPLGLAMLGPEIDAIGRGPVLLTAAGVALLTPLMCLPVKGITAFRTPSSEVDVQVGLVDLRR